MSAKADSHVVLLPQDNYYGWLAAAQAYAVQFSANLTSDANSAGRVAGVVTIAGAPGGYPSQGDIQAWFAQNFPQVRVDYVPAASPDDFRSSLQKRLDANDPFLTVITPTYAWPPGRCLLGVHGRADGPMQPADFKAIQAADVEAVKLLTWARPQDIDALRQIRPDVFILARLMTKIGSPSQFSDFFVSEVQSQMAAFYARGIRYFEVHNEPNLKDEGWLSSWQNGTDFARFFMEVRQKLKAAYPDALLGWPGLSPGPALAGLRMKDTDFLEQADAAVRAADWVGVHCYWQSAALMEDETVGGRIYRNYRQRYPDKLLFITEFSNRAEPAAVKAPQYLAYYQSLRNEPGVGAAFSFVVSASGPFSGEAWRDEAGNLSAIPATVGARPAF